MQDLSPAQNPLSKVNDTSRRSSLVLTPDPCLPDDVSCLSTSSAYSWGWRPLRKLMSVPLVPSWCPACSHPCGVQALLGSLWVSLHRSNSTLCRSIRKTSLFLVHGLSPRRPPESSSGCVLMFCCGLHPFSPPASGADGGAHPGPGVHRSSPPQNPPPAASQAPSSIISHELLLMQGDSSVSLSVVTSRHRER